VCQFRLVARWKAIWRNDEQKRGKADDVSRRGQVGTLGPSRAAQVRFSTSRASGQGFKVIPQRTFTCEACEAGEEDDDDDEVEVEE